jgi:hypothetical protein
MDTTSVYIVHTIVGDGDTSIYRIPATELDKEKLRFMEKWNNACDGVYGTPGAEGAKGDKGAKEQNDAVFEITSYLHDHPEWEVKRSLPIGRSYKLASDQVTDLFTFWCQI